MQYYYQYYIQYYYQYYIQYYYQYYIQYYYQYTFRGMYAGVAAVHDTCISLSSGRRETMEYGDR